MNNEDQKINLIISSLTNQIAQKSADIAMLQAELTMVNTQLQEFREKDRAVSKLPSKVNKADKS